MVTGWQLNGLWREKKENKFCLFYFFQNSIISRFDYVSFIFFNFENLIKVKKISVLANLILLYKPMDIEVQTI